MSTSPRVRPARHVTSAPRLPTAPTLVAAAMGRLMPPTVQASMAIFWLLTGVNFLNYLDRIVFVAVGPELKHDFNLNDAQIGITASAFLLIYTLTALPMGLLADRVSRTRIIAVGIALWSLATGYTAISHTFAELFIGRAILGIGEASYLPAGAALLVAYFPMAKRAQILSRWGASTLVGAAVGFVLGGVIAQHFSWRWAFVICGPPGLILAWLIWRSADRPAYDETDLHARAALAAAMPAATGAHAGFTHALAGMAAQARTVLRSPTVRVSILLQGLGLFVTTPAVVFIPIYLRDHFHMPIQTTALLTGGLLIPAGVGGALLGGWLADRLGRRWKSARILVVAISFGGAAPFLIIGLLSRNLAILLPLAFIGTAFLNMYNGPLNAAIQDVVPPALRASALAVIMTIAHLVGDVSSPTIVGALAGRLAGHDVARALAILGGPALILGTLVALWSARLYTREAPDIPPGGDVIAPSPVHV